MIWRMIILTLACLLVACQADTSNSTNSTTLDITTSVPVPTPPPSLKAKPPTINSGFTKVIYFRGISDGKQLDCTADGIPQPSYEWFKDGKKLVTDTGTNIVISGGRLELTAPDYRNIGLYQCLATNPYGTSKSSVVDIKRAYIDGYPTLSIINKEFSSGDHAVLECRSQPISYPAAHVDWYLSKTKAIKPSAKIVLDQRGSLHFINVEKVNELQGDMTYNCSLYNDVAQLRNYGSPTKLKVNELTGPIPHRGPTISYFTPEEKAVALLGSKVTLQCIPDGYPIPTIEWSKEGGELPVGRHEINPLMYKLEIRDVTEIDEGNYACTAVHGNKTLSQRIFVNVKSEPIWVEKMRSLTLTNGKTATFECFARSVRGEIDNVTVKWFKNRQPLNPGTTAKITVSGTRLTVANVIKPDDLSNFQCNVTNTIGYQMADAFLNVIDETILTVAPYDNIAIDPGEAVGVPIAAVADPLYADRLTYTWTKDRVPVGKDPKQYVYVNPAHTLVINATTLARDEFLQVLGDYSCYVSMGLDGGEGDITTYTTVSSNEEEKSDSTTLDITASTQMSTVSLPPPSSSDSTTAVPKSTVSPPPLSPGDSTTAVPKSTVSPPPLSPANSEAALDLWWIAMIAAVVVLIIIIIIICLLYRNRGDTYPVDKIERRAGHDPERELADREFQDLSRADAPGEREPYGNPDQMSLTNDPPLGASTDSLDAYGEPDTSQFNEDGSFIGNYGRKGRDTNQSTV